MYVEMILLFSGAFCTCQQISHVLLHHGGCFETGDALVSVTFDGDEVYYADYKKGKLEWDSRIPSAIRPPYAYIEAYEANIYCPHDKHNWDDVSVPYIKEAPETVIYTKDEGIVGVENTLICFVNNFFPPSIKVKWTKNDEEVTVEDPVLSYLLNPDLTYHHISTLTFTPQEGDVYACTVEHEALQEPQTRFWDPPDITESSSAPAVFCGVGLTLGLLGITTGTFLIVKAKK